jgi:RNA-splicing ligase RtcB
MIPVKGKYTTAEIMLDSVEKKTMGQIIQMANHPAFTNHMAIMPDTHYGAGSVIGLTMLMGDKLVPDVVGRDINCAMLMLMFDEFRLDMDRAEIDKLIRSVVPFGKKVREKPAYDMERSFPWHKANELNLMFCKAFNERFKARMAPTNYDYKWFENKCNQIGMNVKRAVNSIGTLGGGNHFIEFGMSKETGKFCATIHTGSRQFGYKICGYWQTAPARRKRQEKIQKFNRGLVDIKSTLKGKAISKAIKKLKSDLGINNRMAKGLGYLEGEDMQGYLSDMVFCQIYAHENRRIIASEIIKALGADEPLRIETIHNYIDFNDFVIRKGAVSAHKGEVFILPFNMEDGILLCKGKGNKEWNQSAPHGAGRLKSRTKAKAECSAEVARKRMEAKGIYTSVIPVDEVKEAYKDPKIIEEAIGPTADIIDRIIPIMNLKEDDEKKKEA